MKKNELTLKENPQRTSAQLALADYLRELTQGPVVVAKNCLTLPEIRRGVAPGEIAEIRVAAFWAPLLSDAEEWKHGKMFAYAAPDEPLGLYWQVGMYKHYCRPLTWQETRKFRDLTKKSLPRTSTMRRPTSRRKT